MAVRGSLYLRAGVADDLAAAEGWLEAWRASLTYLSDDYGCECCSSCFDAEGSAEAIAAIPPSLRVESAWTQGDGASPREPVLAASPFRRAKKRLAPRAKKPF